MTTAKLEAGNGMDEGNNTGNRYAKILTGSWWVQFRYGSNPWMARYVYSVMFLLANLLAWAVRDYGPTVLTQMNRSVAHFGAGVFLLIQLISMISFITWLNDHCLSEKYAEKCRTHFTLLAIAAYFVSILGIILMYIWYTPHLTCQHNIFFITWTLFLLQLMTSVSLHPKVNAGFLTSGIMGLYIVFLCWSAIRSEPPDENCLRKSGVSRDWLTIISFVIALLAMVIATFSTGIDSQCFQSRKDEKQEEDDVPYGFGFFHLVFASGVMYFAMLLIGWNSHHTMKKWTIDVGWTSTWVRIVNEWLAVCVYLWMLVAPIVWKCRQAEEPKSAKEEDKVHCICLT
ncbi:hypothetical protein M8C21_023215 [Ambrosia artemisiifolia]|uniref:Serine incorporator n=1 Tax=Ambrosia artemisiifolia TaxID=4212 RepID=A0AAD5C0G6_AMBAR|nr:hypothetical protein M8C21_023215 [Ambrosia artemisiifolia]